MLQTMFRDQSISSMLVPFTCKEGSSTVLLMYHHNIYLGEYIYGSQNSRVPDLLVK